jgi:signal transduction histidine kinase
MSTEQATVLPLAQHAPGLAAHEQLHLIRQAGRALAAATSERDIWQALVNSLKDVCHFATCSILQVDAAGNYKLVVIIRHPLSQRFLQQNIEKLAGKVLQTEMPPVNLPHLAVRQVLEASAESERDEADKQPMAERIEAFLAQPLVSQGRMIGMVGLADERWGVFDKEHEAFLGTLADYTAIALENIRLRQVEHSLGEQTLPPVFRDTSDEMQMEKWKDDFLSSISHELRTPLTPIKGYTQHLLRRAERKMAAARAEADGQFSEPPAESYEQHCLGIIQSEAEHLERLVNNLLDFSLLQQGAIRLHPVEFDLAELVRQTVQSIQVSAEQHQFSINIWAKHTSVRADRERIRVVIGNLIDNAVKFSPNGGPVTINLEAREHELVVAVIDKGIGIAPEQLTRLFDRFYHPSALSSHQYGGIGVSLYLAQAILKLHDGRIWAESNRNQSETGAMVAFALPKEDATAAESAHEG